MGCVNRVSILGHLGADPELRNTKGGTAVCNLRVATSEKWKDRDGNMQEKTEWHRIVVWGKQAESCGKYLSRGRQVFVEGSLETREWNDRDGNKRQTTEIKARNVVFLGSGGGGNSGGGAGTHRTSHAPAQQPQPGSDDGKWKGQGWAPNEGAADGGGDEDLPF